MHRRFAAIYFVLLALLAVLMALGFVQVIRGHQQTAHYVTQKVPATLKLLKLDTDLHQAQMAMVRAARPGNAKARPSYLARYENNVQQAIERFNAFGQLAETQREQQMLADFKTARAKWLQATAALKEKLLNADADEDIQQAVDKTEQAFQALQEPINAIESKFYDPIAKASAIEVNNQFYTLLLMGVVIAGMLFSGGLILYYAKAAGRHEQTLRRRDAEREADHRRRHFEGRINDALSMAGSEPQALRLMAEAAEEVYPQGPTEILLADASNAHMYQAVTTDTEHGRPGCPVGTPSACPAVQRGEELTFQESEGFDACPYLRERETGGCSATCVPISIMGQAVGVLHATGPVYDPPSQEQTEQLATIASKSSERIGMLRVFEQAESQAVTDPLTGLANRRHLESEIKELHQQQTAYAVAYIDLDHFKQLNDTHGHETGDRALRLFSRVVSDTIRPNDTACRWGGEEFVVLLPRATASSAVKVVQRICRALDQILANGDTPAFTISAGLADSSLTGNFEDVLEQADKALMQAKDAGRACIRIAEACDAQEPTQRALDQLFHSGPDAIDMSESQSAEDRGQDQSNRVEPSTSA
jgi:diguanylate cyclase (GGDEF)-like protein